MALTIDISFEAAFLRAGLLLGLCHEADVPDWAERIIVDAPADQTARLADVIACKVELSAMREALRLLAESVEPSRVAAALFITVAVEQAVSPRTAVDLLRILEQMRWEFRLPPDLAARIKDFEHRAMLARAGLRGQVAPAPNEIAAFLGEVRRPGFFHLFFDTAEEVSAFVAALSRKVVRDRTWGDRQGHAAAQAWLLRNPAGRRHAVAVNESALMIVLREFGPVPIASRIPYPDLGPSAIQVIDEATATPLGVEQARAVVRASEAG